MPTLLSLIVTILASSHFAAAYSCYYDAFNVQHCNGFSNGARWGIGIGVIVLAAILLFLVFFRRRRMMMNRNAILLQRQQQQGPPSQWAGPQNNAGSPYGQPYGQPYVGPQPYGQPYGGPTNTGYQNNQPQPYTGYTGVYTAATPAANTKGYDVPNDKSAGVQPPERVYNPSQPNATSSTTGNPHANNPVDPSSQPPEYSGYDVSNAPPQMPTPTGASRNPEGYSSNNPYIYNPPNQAKS